MDRRSGVVVMDYSEGELVGLSWRRPHLRPPAKTVQP